MGNAASRAADLTERARGPLGSTLLLGLGVQLAAWLIAFGDPAPNLDPSAFAGLYMAIHEGVHFGNDIVFSYGPLGFLSSPTGWYTGLQTLSFIWLVTLTFALTCGLIWTLRRTFGAIAASFIAFLVMALLGPDLNLAFALAAVLIFAALRADPPRAALPALVFGGSFLAAMEMLIKISIGPALLVVFPIALVGAGASRRLIALFFGLFAAELLLLWLLAGQSLGDLPAYFSHGREIISGYSESVGLRDDGDGLQTAALILAALTVPALGIGAAMGDYRDRAARWAGIAVALVGAFGMFKQASVLLERHHIAEGLATSAVIWLAIPWRPTPVMRAAAATGLVVMAGMATAYFYRDDTEALTARLEVTSNVERAFTQLGDLLQPGEREQRSENVKALMAVGYGLDAEMLAQLREGSVTVEPWEIAAAWAYDLDWNPLPVMQNYAAYTSGLDEINSDRVASAAGPERIMRLNPIAILPGFEHRGYANRWQGWDPPGQTLAILCNFETLSTSEIWQILGRVPDRCGEPELLESVDSAYGEIVDVPEPGPGQVVFARIDGAGVGGLESIRNLLWRAAFRYAVFDDGRRWRLVPATASDGLLLRGPPELTGKGEFAQAPQTTTLELTGREGDLRYDFYAMDIELTPTERARIGGEG